jgi:molecular chaperone DnaK
LAEQFRVRHGVDLRNDAVALQRLKEAAEQAKIELSSTMATDINLPFIAVGPGGPQHLTRSLSRGELERACKDAAGAAGAAVRQGARAGALHAADIDQVLLVGGMTRMPAVQEAVVGIFGKPAHKGVNPDEIVAAGAAVHSAVIGGELQEVVLLDVTPHDLGVKVAGDKMSVIIPANTSIPTREKKVFATTEDNQTFVAVEVHQGRHEQASQEPPAGALRPRRSAAGAARRHPGRGQLHDGRRRHPPRRRGRDRDRQATSVKIEAGSGLSNDEIKRLAAGMR